MKLPQFSIMAGAMLVSFALGLILAPSLRQTGAADASPFQGKSAAANPRASLTTEAPANSPSRTRVRDREPAKQPEEPRISIPVKTVVALLHEGGLQSAGFMNLEDKIDRALETLGASKAESDEIKNLIKKSKDEINAAQKAHFKLGVVTPDYIEIETGGIRESISAIVSRLQDGIHATLNPQAAEVLVSAIDWKKYYRINENPITSLELKRERSGGFTAWESVSGLGIRGSGVDNKFPDDGTPLPADQIFPEPWKTYLKGLTLVPKDGE